MKCNRALTAFVVALLWGCATTPPPVPDALAKKQLAPKDFLRVAVFTGNSVIGTSDRRIKEVKGSTEIIGRELARQAGFTVQMIEYTSVAKMLEATKAGSWDVAVDVCGPGHRDVLDFAPPHLSIDLTYLVAPGANIRTVADADRAGLNILAVRGSASALYLERNLKQALVIPADNELAALELFRLGKGQAYAQNRYLLLQLGEELPAARVLDDRFSTIQMCLVLPKGRAAALNYVGDFVRHARTSGLVAGAIERARLHGVNPAN